MRSDITPGQTSDYLDFDLIMDKRKRWKHATLCRSSEKQSLKLFSDPSHSRCEVPQASCPVDRQLYRLRNLVERCFNEFKNAHHVATRYNKAAESFWAS